MTAESSRQNNALYAAMSTAEKIKYLEGLIASPTTSAPARQRLRRKLSKILKP